jgi:plasmid stability protein
MAPNASTNVTQDPAAADARLVSGRPSSGIARAATYAFLGASADALPLPFVSDPLVARVRGALLHDFAAAHGVSLSPEARTILAGASAREDAQSMGQKAATFVGVRLALRLLRRLGPIWAIWPLRQAARTLLLAHLFDRYLDVVRKERAVRVDAGEARRVRQAIDGALGHAFTMQVPAEVEAGAVDDQRDQWTALVDGVLGAAAGLPNRMLRRLEAAFDDLLAKADG